MSLQRNRHLWNIIFWSRQVNMSNEQNSEKASFAALKIIIEKELFTAVSTVVICATGIWTETYESYLESVLLTQSDQSQHLKQSKWLDTDASSHSTALYGGPTPCCAAEVLSLLGCACSAALASTLMLTTVPEKPLGRHAVMLIVQGESIPILFVQRCDISRTFVHEERFTLCRNFCSTRELQEWACSSSARE